MRTVNLGRTFLQHANDCQRHLGFREARHPFFSSRQSQIISLSLLDNTKLVATFDRTPPLGNPSICASRSPKQCQEIYTHCDPEDTFNTIQYKYNTIQKQYNTIQYNTIQYNTTQHNTTQHNTTQHNTTQYITLQHTIYSTHAAHTTDTTHNTQRNVAQCNTK